MAATRLVWSGVVWPGLVWSRLVEVGRQAGNGLAAVGEGAGGDAELGRRLTLGKERGASALLCFSLWGAEEECAVVEAILQPQCVLTAGRLGLISRPNGEGVELRRARSLPLLHLHACTPARHKPQPASPPPTSSPVAAVAAVAAHPAGSKGACMRAPCRLHPPC
jgi:hypothetical protein